MYVLADIKIYTVILSIVHIDPQRFMNPAYRLPNDNDEESDESDVKVGEKRQARIAMLFCGLVLTGLVVAGVAVPVALNANEDADEKIPPPPPPPPPSTPPSTPPPPSTPSPPTPPPPTPPPLPQTVETFLEYCPYSKSWGDSIPNSFNNEPTDCTAFSATSNSDPNGLVAIMQGNDHVRTEDGLWYTLELSPGGYYWASSIGSTYGPSPYQSLGMEYYPSPCYLDDACTIPSINCGCNPLTKSNAATMKCNDGMQIDGNWCGHWMVMSGWQCHAGAGPVISPITPSQTIFDVNCFSSENSDQPLPITWGRWFGFDTTGKPLPEYESNKLGQTVTVPSSS